MTDAKPKTAREWAHEYVACGVVTTVIAVAHSTECNQATAVIEAAVAAERARCKRWAEALRFGEIDDARSVIGGIGSGDRWEDER